MIAFGALSLEIKAAVAAAAAAALFAAGWSVEGWRKEAEIADLQKVYAEQQASAARAASEDLMAAQARGDSLTARLYAANNALNDLTKEKEDAVRRLTTGRPCLGSAAVRVLNSTPASLHAPTVPQTASQPVPADGGFATDTDVGLWIAGAQRSFRTCRGRLQAVADFYSTAPVDASTPEQE